MKDDLHVSVGTAVTGRDMNASCEPTKPVRDGESLTVTLTSQNLGRAIGYCVTEFNSDKGDLCALSGGWWRAIGGRSVREPLKPVESLMSLYPKLKEKGRADPSRESATLNMTGDYYGQEEGSRENHTRETTNRSMTCHSSRGVESLSDQDPRIMGTKCPSPEMNFGSTSFPLAPRKEPKSLMKRCPPNESWFQARERGMTRTIAKRESQSAVERSLAARMI